MFLLLQRNSRRHRFQAYDLDLMTLNDRLVEIEKRVGELETSIPQELEEWQRLKQVFLYAFVVHFYAHTFRGAI